MTTVKLRYVKRYRDRHGLLRCYFRRSGARPIPLPGLPGSPPFMAAYNAALNGETAPMIGAAACLEFSLAALIASYKQAPDWVKLSQGSKDTYLKCLKPIESQDGHRSAKDLPPEKAIKVIQEVAARSPSMANTTRTIMRKLFDHAIYLGWRKHGSNPFAGIKRYKVGSHHTWTDAEVEKFTKRWPLGTRERMAFDLYYYTAQRTADVCKMMRTDIRPAKDGRGEALYVKQKKTGVELLIPIHPGLRKSMHAYGIRGPALCGRIHDGKRMAEVSFGQFMAEAIELAGLPDECVPHGIRKHVLSAVAERGGSTKQIASLSGHKTLKEIEHYTEKADQGRLAIAAVQILPDLASV